MGAVTHSQSKGTVLIVDDDRDIRESLVEIVEESGRQAVQARDGEEALALLDQVERPCLILLDLWMPGGVDGTGFLKRLQEHEDREHFRVLVISASHTIERAGTYPGVVGLLRKPFDIPTLLTALDNHC